MIRKRCSPTILQHVNNCHPGKQNAQILDAFTLFICQNDDSLRHPERPKGVEGPLYPQGITVSPPATVITLRLPVVIGVLRLRTTPRCGLVLRSG